MHLLRFSGPHLVEPQPRRFDGFEAGLLHLDRRRPLGRVREGAAGDRPMIVAFGLLQRRRARSACSRCHSSQWVSRAIASASVGAAHSMPKRSPVARAQSAQRESTRSASVFERPVAELGTSIRRRVDASTSASQPEPLGTGGFEQRIDPARRASRRPRAARSAAPAGRRCGSGRSRRRGSGTTVDGPMTGSSSGVAGRSPALAAVNPAVQRVRHDLARRPRSGRGPRRSSSARRSRRPPRRADQQRSIVPRHEVAALAPDRRAERAARPRELQQLAADRPHGQPDVRALDDDLPGPAAGREHDARCPTATRDRSRPAVAAGADDAADAAALDRLGAVAARRGRAARASGRRPRRIRATA